MIPIQDLFETHLTVSDHGRGVRFYQSVRGLEPASVFEERKAAFFWIGAPGQAMLGLWETGTGPQRMRLHLAFRVTLDHLFASIAALQSAGVTPLDFLDAPASEPCVIAWMPAASIFFRDPDGNLLEFLCMLDGAPEPGRGVLPWSEWLRR
jgi:lactoylglutathione lyase